MVTKRALFFYQAVVFCLAVVTMTFPIRAMPAVDVFDCPLGTNPVFQETWACGQRDLGMFYDTRVSPEDMEHYYRLLFRETEWKELEISGEARTWMNHWMAGLSGGGMMNALLPRILFSNGSEFWSLTVQESGGKSKVFLHLKSMTPVSTGSEMLSGIPAPYPNSKLLLSHQTQNAGERTEFYSFQGGPDPEAVLDHLGKGFKDAGWRENPLFDAFRENLRKIPDSRSSPRHRMDGKDWKADVYQKEGQMALVFADQERGLPFVFYGVFLRKGNFNFGE